MNLQKKILLIMTTFFLLSLIACEEQETSLVKDNRPTVKVKITKVQNRVPISHLSLSGKIQAKDFVTVSARTMGYITKINAKVGDKVKAGQALVELSNEDLQNKMAQVDAQVLELETGLRNVEKDYARIQSLFDQQSATQKELDDIMTQRDMMKAQLKQAKEGKNEINTNLSYSIVKAPISGVITEKWVHDGELASPGKPLFNMESGKKFQVEVMIPESKIAQVKKGDQVTIILKSSGKEIRGRISEFSPSAKNTGGQFLTKINLNKKDLNGVKLFSGMYVTVLFQETAVSDQQQIRVAQKAIIQRGQLTGLYTLGHDNTALLRWVRLGKKYGHEVEILSGLSLGESYIIESEGRLRDGIKIEIQ